jgi:hypothetical protein
MDTDTDLAHLAELAYVLHTAILARPLEAYGSMAPAEQRAWEAVVRMLYTRFLEHHRPLQAGAPSSLGAPSPMRGCAEPTCSHPAATHIKAPRCALYPCRVFDCSCPSWKEPTHAP